MRIENVDGVAMKIETVQVYSLEANGKKLLKTIEIRNAVDSWGLN